MYDKYWGVVNDEVFCIKDGGIWIKENIIIYVDVNYIWKFIK